MLTMASSCAALCLHSTLNHSPNNFHPISYNPLKPLSLHSPNKLSTICAKLQETCNSKNSAILACSWKPQQEIFKFYNEKIAVLTFKSKNLAILTCSWKPRKEIFKFYSEKIVFLLLGSFLFMGLRAKNAVAVTQPVQESRVFEEKTETQERNGEEEEMYMKLLEKNPRDVEGLKAIVNVKMRKGKTKEALKYVEKLIEVQPKEIEWRLLEALCYEMIGQLSKAKRLFKDILKKRPLLLRALHGLAMVMHKTHEGPAVFEMLNDALEVARQEERVNEERNIKILVAQIHVVRGELEEALKKFQLLVQENPKDFRPYLCQGIVYSLLDKKEEANKQFEIYRSLVPEEFPQRGFLDDVVLAAKTETREQLAKEFKTEFSYKT